jgi:hypothetical protein
VWGKVKAVTIDSDSPWWPELQDHREGKRRGTPSQVFLVAAKPLLPALARCKVSRRAVTSIPHLDVVALTTT